jgi:hypothetical protein
MAFDYADIKNTSQSIFRLRNGFSLRPIKMKNGTSLPSVSICHSVGFNELMLVVYMQVEGQVSSNEFGCSHWKVCSTLHILLEKIVMIWY